MKRRFAFAFLPLAILAACSSSSDDNGGGSSSGTPEGGAPKPPKYPPSTLPPLGDAKTTAQLSYSPKHASQPYSAGPNPSQPEALATYLKDGFGDLQEGPGLTPVVISVDGSTPPPAGANAKRILRFVSLADLQIADDESPTRLGLYDSAGSTSSALRPQDAYLCHMANAAVRTINALHRKDPIAFTIMGGDNADSAQENEHDWVLGILSGSPNVECDSGDDDDMIAGGGNDGKDPFVAEGLAMPWKWVTGNHDVLIQGNLMIEDANRQAVLGTAANGGTRDYKQGGAVANGDFVVADPKRKLLSRQEMISKIMSDKDGHGLTDKEKASGYATYTFDTEGNFRFLVIDTAHERGGAEGVITQREIDRVIKPALDKAKADGKWVILASHHAQSSMSLDGGAFGKPETDALDKEAWATFLGKYDNVLFSMVGHSHENRVRVVKPTTGHAYWEVMTAAIADYPHQFRINEIFDQDNGWLMMRAVPVDISVEGDAIAEEGRRRGVVDVVTGWNPGDGTGKSADRLVEIWIKKPGQ